MDNSEDRATKIDSLQGMISQLAQNIASLWAPSGAPSSGQGTEQEIMPADAEPDQAPPSQDQREQRASASRVSHWFPQGSRPNLRHPAMKATVRKFQRSVRNSPSIPISIVSSEV